MSQFASIQSPPTAFELIFGKHTDPLAELMEASISYIFGKQKDPWEEFIEVFAIIFILIDAKATHNTMRSGNLGMWLVDVHWQSCVDDKGLISFFQCLCLTVEGYCLNLLTFPPVFLISGGTACTLSEYLFDFRMVYVKKVIKNTKTTEQTVPPKESTHDDEPANDTSYYYWWFSKNTTSSQKPKPSEAQYTQGLNKDNNRYQNHNNKGPSQHVPTQQRRSAGTNAKGENQQAKTKSDTFDKDAKDSSSLAPGRNAKRSRSISEDEEEEESEEVSDSDSECAMSCDDDSKEPGEDEMNVEGKESSQQMTNVSSTAAKNEIDVIICDEKGTLMIVGTANKGATTSPPKKKPKNDSSVIISH